MNQEYPDLQVEATTNLCRIATNCRMCKSRDLEEYLDLGFTAPADQFRKKEELEFPEITYPLKVVVCKNCGLSQLSHIVNPRVLYQFDYPYESSTTKTGKMHWDAFAGAVAKRLSLPQGSLVIDVGSNVGTLLDSFKNLGMRVFGVDPAPNIVAIANESGIETMCEFFGVPCVEPILRKAGKASVIVGTNVFAHIDDLHDVMNAAKELLTDDGVFIFESPYFQHLVDKLEYDTIYHEHLSYLSVEPLVPFFEKFGMEVFAIEESKIHGGSMRVYIGKKGLRPIDSSVTDLLAAEKKHKLNDIETLRVFAERVANNRKELMALIESLLKEGKKIVGVSAPAKGMTLLSYNGFSRRHLPFITEKARLKIGRYAPGGAGGHIPIVPDDMLMQEQPDYALLLAWNFADEIMKNLSAFKEKGGKFIIPIPNPRIM